MGDTRISWSRVMVEGVVIVASILLAFGIDAWWDDANERRAEQVYLGQLQEDLQRAERQLAAAADYQEEASQSVLMVIAASQDAVPPPNDSLAVWLGAVGFSRQGTPTLSTAQGLVGSDVLQSIESAEVRTGLVTLLDQLSQMQQQQAMHEQLFMEGLFRLNRVVPAMARGMPRRVGMLGNEPDTPSRQTHIEGILSVDLRPFLEDPEFLAAVDEMWISHENMRALIQGMLNETRAFLAVINAALDEP